MKRTIALNLTVNCGQGSALRDLQAIYTSACNTIALIATAHSTTNRVRLHHLAYYAIRERFPALGSQMTCNAIASVAHSLKAHRTKGRSWNTIVFRPDGAVHFDARTFRIVGEAVSLFTMIGRQHIPLRLGEFQRKYLARGTIGEAELVRRGGGWSLNVALTLADVAPRLATGVLGVDLGENVAAATNNTLYGGGKLKDLRDRFLAFRKRLQRNGSQSAKRRLKRVSGRESRHVRHVNHEISASIVREALKNDCGTIAMENLSNLRSRIRAGKKMRTRLHRWAWRQLQQFVAYKAETNGIRVRYVNPAYTSQTCAVCGRRGARRRHRFFCMICGIFAHSDRNAARNIAKIASSALLATGGVMRPDVATRVDHEALSF